MPISAMLQEDNVNALVIAVLIIAGFLVAGWVMWWLLTGVVHYYTRKSKTTLDDVILNALSGPMVVAIALAGLAIARRYTDLIFPAWDAPMRTFLFVAYLIIAYVALFRLVARGMDWYLRERAPHTETNLDDQFLPFFRRILLIGLTLAFLIILLQYFGYPVTSLVATLGIGSLAVALAAQASLNDVISGFLIMTDRPFRIGDRIQIESAGIIGDVRDVGIRSTHILTLDNRMIVVPNSVVAANVVINEAYPDPSLRLDIPAGVAYGSDVQAAKAVIKEAVLQIPGIQHIRRPEVLFMGLGDSALDLEVRVWIDAYADRYRMIDRINETIYNALNEHGIEIPFPQRTVWHRAEPSAVPALRQAFSNNAPPGEESQPEAQS